MWSDVIADRTADIGTALLAFLHRMEQRHPSQAVRLPEGEGEVAGISYRIRGAGPPLVLLPLELAPSQWEPLLSTLSARYCTITLGGAALGIVAVLEARGRGGYLGVVRSLLDAVQVQPGEVVLDVGCGSGVVTRWVARQTGGANRLVGMDINAHLLREATALARREGLGDVIMFQEGNAEALPFPEQSFDVTLACTVLEEGDADRMLAELVRVTKLGGRVAVIVRAIDMPRWVNLALSASLKAKVDTPGLIGAGVGPQECADTSLYRRSATAGLTRLTVFPQFVAVTSADPRLVGQQQQLLATLSPDEALEWRCCREASSPCAGVGLRRRPWYMGVTGTGPVSGVSAIAVPTAAAWSAGRWFSRNASSAWRRLWTRCKRSTTCTACGSPPANAIGVQVAAIATDHRDGGMLGQPGRDGGGRAIRQQVDDAICREIDQDGAIPMASPPGPLVHPDGLQGLGVGYRGGAHKSQEGGRTRRQP
jgi:ubiquinone/menaquinone biosynthesis C-methylase UbiE